MSSYFVTNPKGEGYIERCQLRSVMKADPFADVKGPDKAVVGSFPGFCEIRYWYLLFIEFHQVVEGEEANACGYGIFRK